MELTILMPCLNEAETLEICIKKAKGFLEKYGVDYIYVSYYERSKYNVDEEALRRNYDVVFENPAAVIFAVPEG